MSDPITGGCACGQVRYEISGEPGFSFHCQCRKCQRASGTGHASIFIVTAEAITATGILGAYTQSSDSGHDTAAHFCPTCGSPVLNRADRFPESRYIHAASLDDPALFKPERVMFRAPGQAWDYIDPELPWPAPRTCAHRPRAVCTDKPYFLAAGESS